VTTFEANPGPTPNVLSWQTAADGPAARTMTFQTVLRYGPEGATAALLRSPEDDCLYTITDQGVAGSSASVARFQHGQLQALPFRIECILTPIVDSLRWFLTGTAIIIAIACTTLPILATRLREQSTDTSVWRGHDNVRLSSLNRRYLARMLDCLLIFSPLLPPVIKVLLQIDGDWLLLLGNDAQISLADAWLRPLYYLQAHLIASIAIWSTVTVIQGLYGVTPGKWLCGIRVVNTRLRPCGILRSLLRELFMVVDVAEPGMIGLLVSDHQQRVGDFYADTVVVDKDSLLVV